MRLICNSIPKSGTYLLGAIARFCDLHDSNLRFVDTGTTVVDDHNVLVRFEPSTAPERLAALSDGHYAPSHLTYSESLEDFILKGSYRHLFIFRNPLDILYSYVRFVTYSQSFASHGKSTADLQNTMKSGFESDEARMCHVFETMSANFNFRANLRWRQSAACHPVRFEDLYRDVLGLKAGSVGPVLAAVFDYVGLHGSVSAEAAYGKIYGVGPTFMKGEEKVGQFRRLDRAKLAPILDNPEFNDIVRQFGYEGVDF